MYSTQASQPWMNDGVLDLMHKRDHEYKCFLKTRTNESLSKYKVLCNAVMSTVQHTKGDFFVAGARSGSKCFGNRSRDALGWAK